MTLFQARVHIHAIKHKLFKTLLTLHLHTLIKIEEEQDKAKSSLAYYIVS